MKRILSILFILVLLISSCSKAKVCNGTVAQIKSRLVQSKIIYDAYIDGYRYEIQGDSAMISPYLVDGKYVCIQFIELGCCPNCYCPASIPGYPIAGITSIQSY